MKVCSKCKQEKELDDFYRSSKSKDGRQSWCKECAKEGRTDYYAAHASVEAEKQRIAKRKHREWRMQLKCGKPCTRCGGVFHPAAMHWHHLGEKIAEVSSLKSKRQVLAEIAKCELMCANCHAVITFENSETGT